MANYETSMSTGTRKSKYIQGYKDKTVQHVSFMKQSYSWDNQANDGTMGSHIHEHIPIYTVHI
jgi:hypothetical protein